MERYAKLPLLFFAIAAGLGVFLRWQFIIPTPEVHYTFFLHAHSHTMFLGWIFNAFAVGFTIHFIQKDHQGVFKKLFLIAQVLIVLMLISFPIEGYGFYSILFSTLHTILVFVFGFQFFRATKKLQTVSAWFAKVSLIFFMLSSLGPFSLGYLMSQGLGQSQWYYFSIYYYLHFQYNGFFIFAAFSLLLQLFEQQQTEYNNRLIKDGGRWLAVVCIPTYLLSVLWANPPTWIYIVATVSSVIQLVVAAIMLWTFKNTSLQNFTKPGRILLRIAVICFALKIILQAASSAPAVAMFAYEYRPVIIAYLHLIFLGIISATILAWYIEMRLIPSSRVWIPLLLFIGGFTATEFSLIFQSWWSTIFPSSTYVNAATLNLACAVVLAVASLMFWAIAVTKSDKDHTWH